LLLRTKVRAKFVLGRRGEEGRGGERRGEEGRGGERRGEEGRGGERRGE
jgi:hypothetical protein